MNVLHVNCNYICSILHQTMLEHLEEADIQGNVFVPTYDCRLVSFDSKDTVKVVECFKKWDRLLFDYKQKKIRSCVQKNYDIFHFDCIHAYTLFTDGNCAMHLSRLYGIPYIVAVRNTDINCFFKRMVFLRARGILIMEKASAILFLSEAYRKQVFEKYVPKRLHQQLMRKTYVIPNGIDDFWYNNLCQADVALDKKIDRLSHKRLRVIYAGRINRNKNIQLIQRALSRLRQQRWETELTVVGRAEDKKEYLRVAEDPYTKCLGEKTKEQLLNIYRENDLYVMPSHTETFGLVYAEAMTQGLPVLYTRGQGFDEQFEDGKIGYAVSSHDAKQLCDRILDVIADYERIVKNCVPSTYVFQWQAICQRYKRIYEGIIHD